MRKYIIKRILISIVILFFVAFVIYALMRCLPTSYVEASATSGFGYGILKAVHMGLVDAAYAENAKKALAPILKCIREDGIVDQVSYGTAMGRETKDFYKQIPLRQMPYGQAMAMLFLMEAGEEA